MDHPHLMEEVGGRFFHAAVGLGVSLPNSVPREAQLLKRVSAPSEPEGAFGYAWSPLSCPQGSVPNLTPHQGYAKRRTLMHQLCPHCDQPDLSLLCLVLIGEILHADEQTGAAIPLSLDMGSRRLRT